MEDSSYARLRQAEEERRSKLTRAERRREDRAMMKLLKKREVYTPFPWLKGGPKEEDRP